MLLAVGSRFLEGVKEDAPDLWMLAQQGLAHGDYVLDYLWMAGERLPSFPIGVQAAHARLLLPAKEELVDQYHCIGATAREHAQQLLLRVHLPLEARRIHSVA